MIGIVPVLLLQRVSPEVSAAYRKIARILSIVESPRHFGFHGCDLLGP